MKYMYTLIEIQKNIQSKNEFKGQSTHFMIQDNVHVLEYRINYLMDGMYRKKNEQNSNDCRISSSITYKQHYFGVCI